MSHQGMMCSDLESYKQALSRIRKELSLNTEFLDLDLTSTAKQIFNVVELNMNEAWKEYEYNLASDLVILTNNSLKSSVISKWIIQESHNNQRRPIQLSLAKKSFIYKPRNLASDIAWNEFINWLGIELGHQISSVYKIINKSKYGWCEFVSHNSCNSKSDILDYYRNLGILIAIIWVIGGRDACGANIVACGKFPTIIDAEMILSPSNSIYSDNIFNEFKEGGLVPKRNVSINGNILSFGAAHITEALCIHEDSFHTNQICNKPITSKRCMSCKNIPHFNDKGFSVNGHEIYLIEGYKIGINLLLNVKNKILYRTSPFELFQFAHGRVTLRPSVAYSAIKKIFINDLIFNNIQTDIREVLKNLPYNAHASKYYENSILFAESNEIIQLDIPRFSLSFKSNRLLLDNNKILCKYQFSAFDRAIKRIKGLTKKTSINAVLQFEKYLASY
ncbi:lantibiotic modifying enzyme [Chryseobacterium defluvii]|uniref:Lantibiotic modifying enzyme n=1 Tax=Chryseobacterium defluvii TaxID=160396 RepID=A0A840KG67_9FLAO|nr:DUF4135 domain-containing protein [Chryseobacterium defluvii]MBB4807018.1 lantibiotic modifying enzyme [Chryseobacterium defluvii]